MLRNISTVFITIILLLITGCSSLIPVPQVELVSEKEAQQAWKRVLKIYVDAEGRVNFRSLGKKLNDLNRFLKFVSETDRSNFKNNSDKLAFLLNAYNALSMSLVITKDYPADIDSFLKRAKFFAFTKMKIMQEEMSLYALENDIIRKEGDPRVHVALNCMSVGCPRLPREPFMGNTLNSQLEREAKLFFNEERNVKIVPQEKTVYLSQILDFFTDDFLAKKPTLIEYVNQYSQKKIPLDYKVKFTPYNWTVNYSDPNYLGK